MKSSPDHGVRATAWSKSSYSGGEGGNCVEVALGHLPLIPVRDSKRPHGPTLAFRPEAWSAFVRATRHTGE
ncbi:DUF397 domain-containing protein [Streptomyces sp. NBC_00289]|uniref:DUF397 domain-containing protein n=1 Tax=Streptomyces sp. NBC_00289 TaxID=2975703 RepID=UPI0032548BCF